MVITAMCGDHRIAPRCSSMKLDSSSTTRSVFSMFGSSGNSDLPMFPPTHVR